MHVKEDRGQNFGTSFLEVGKHNRARETHIAHVCVCVCWGAHRALGRVDLVQQSHDFFTEAERSGVAGRRRAVRQPEKATESQKSCELHGSETC